MIDQLLLVRKFNSRSDLLEKAGMAGFTKGDPLNIMPDVWEDKDGVSHYGYILGIPKLDDFNNLQQFVKDNEGLTLLDMDTNITATLAAVGLRINESA